jgi:hypothetical protein
MVFPGKWYVRLVVGGKRFCYLATNRDAGRVGRHNCLENAYNETLRLTTLKNGRKLERQYLINSIDPVLIYSNTKRK